jgi:aryl-alcohol dehydrogenase-like predicted oxidoreductase
MKMRYRTLGKTGYKVSEVGYGAWGIAGDWWKGGSDQDALDSMNLAMDLGVNFIDTALGYGNGHSEELVGQAARGRRERVYVATKIRPKNYNFVPGPGDKIEDVFPADWIVECTNTSLKNMGVERIDLQQFHVWLDEWAERDEWKEAVLKLKQQGKIGAFGLSLVFPLADPNFPEKAIAAGIVDSCQAVFNIYQQEVKARLLPLAEKENIGIIVRCPLDEGALTGAITPATTFPAEDWRNNYFAGDRKKEVEERAQACSWVIKDDVESLSEAALRFILSHKAVSTVIVGMRKAQHAEANVRACGKGPLSEADVKRLEKHAWPHNFWA